MLPLRDPILLPDNNAQLADNAWLYRGQVRGFRAATPVFQTQYADTKQVYRIPLNNNNPPDFSSVGSLWLEFPDPFMTTLRNPTVGDTFNRYYFFPSDEYASNANNPAWPTASPGPVYNTLQRLQSGQPNYILGIPAPTKPTTVTPPHTSVIMVTTAPTAVNATVLTFGSSPATAGALVGMNAVDLTTTTVSAAITLPAAIGTSTLTFSSTTGILVGMAVAGVSTPAEVFPGTVVASVTSTTVVLNINLVTGAVAGDTFSFTNSNQIKSGSTIASMAGNTATLSNGVIAAGVLAGDTIQFISEPCQRRAPTSTPTSTISLKRASLPRRPSRRVTALGHGL